MEFDSVFADEHPGPTFSTECISVGIDVGEVRVRMWFDLICGWSGKWLFRQQEEQSCQGQFLAVFLRKVLVGWQNRSALQPKGYSLDVPYVKACRRRSMQNVTIAGRYSLLLNHFLVENIYLVDTKLMLHCQALSQICEKWLLASSCLYGPPCVSDPLTLRRVSVTFILEEL